MLTLQPIEMNPLVISASAIGEEVRTAPNKVNIIDRREIERSTGHTIQDVLQHSEGLYVSRGQGLLVDFQTVVVRGMTAGTFGRNSAVLTTLNGHSLNGTLGSWANIGDLDAIPASIIQKTEVIKGPYASIYGSGATGGVINITTRKHFDRAMGGDVQYKVGPYGFRSIAPAFFGQKDRLTYSAWGEFMHGSERLGRRRKTWNLANGYLDDGRIEQSKYGFMIGYDLNAADRVDLLGSRLEKFNNYDGRPINREEIDSDFLHLTFTRRINDAYTLTVLGNWLRNTYDLIADNNPAHPDSAAWITRTQPFPNREIGIKTVLSGKLGPNHFNTGVEWRRNRSSRTSWWGDREFLEFDVNGTQEIYSLFVEDKLRFGKLELTPGFRVEQWQDNALYSEQETPDNAPNFPGPAPAYLNGRVHTGYASGKDEKEAFSPKVGLAYLHTDHLKIRASAGSTFRAPRITETYSPDYQTLDFLKFLANPGLDEETIISYEAGFDWSTLNQRLDLSATGFLIDARDRIEFTLTGSFTAEDPFVIVHRNLDTEITGIEGEVAYAVGQNLGVGANFSFVDAEYTSGPSAFENEPTPYVPDHTLNANVDYAPIQGLDLRLSMQRIGEITDGLFPGGIDEIFNLKARYEFAGAGEDRYFIDAGLTNLLDEDYQVPSNGVWDYRPLGRGLHLTAGYGF